MSRNHSGTERSFSGLEQLFDGFPSVLNDGLPLGFELVALAGERDLRFRVGVLLAGCTQKAHPDKIENFLLRLRECRNILLFELDGRENGMVICDLAVVGYAGNVRSNRNTCLLYTSPDFQSL